jgi:hypothetical protein
MCFVLFSEQTPVTYLSSINWLVFITEAESAYSEVRAETLNVFQFKFSLPITLKRTERERSMYTSKEARYKKCKQTYIYVYIYIHLYAFITTYILTHIYIKPYTAYIHKYIRKHVYTRYLCINIFTFHIVAMTIYNIKCEIQSNKQTF